MFKVAICEDNEEHQKIIANIVGNIYFSYDDIVIKAYNDGSELIHSIEHGGFDSELLLLDINMRTVSGIKVAEFIRDNELDIDIIFITQSRNHVFDGYTYKAFTYILKPIDVEKLTKELVRYWEEREQSSDCLNISIHGVNHRIMLNRILYFEGNGRKVNIHLLGEVIDFYAKMDEIMDVLQGKSFIRCHQSYIVNKKFIKSFARNEIQVRDEMIPVSRKYVDVVKSEL